MKQLRDLAEFTENFTLEKASEAVITAAKYCITDTLAVGIGATENPMLKGIKEIYLINERPGTASADLWGTGEKAAPRTAAFLNAMASHILELDDVHTASKTHIGTVVVPAAWAAAQACGCGGSKLLEAVICGYETMSRIGMGFGVSGHRNQGWQVTGTAGTFGAAAACSKIYGFDTRQIVSTFGLAGMQSCSTWAFLEDSATDKVLHPARAAASGLESCLLVKGGMTGSSHILDAADGGIFPMMSDAFDYKKVNAGLGEIWEILNIDKKTYPCCRSVHGSIDAALALRDHFHIEPSEIERVDIDTYLVGYKQCGFSEGSLRPTTPTEARFSTPYVTATALLTGSVGLSDFRVNKILDPNRQELLRRVHVYEAAAYTEQYPEHWGCCMTLIMKNGNRYSKHIEDASGSKASPLTVDQIIQKATACCESFPASKRAKVFTALEKLDEMDALPETMII